MQAKLSRQEKRQLKVESLANEYAVTITEFYNRYLSLSKLTSENWYFIEHNNIVNYAILLNVPTNLFAAMVAVTSPLKRWNENIAWVIEIIKYCQGDNNARIKQGIEGNCNKAIALYRKWEKTGIFCDNDTKNVTGDKTSAFYSNLLYPDTSLHITVDVWMLRLARKEWQAPSDDYKCPKLHIDAIRLAYMQVWAKLELYSVGIMPHMLQSACWTQVKNTSIWQDWFTDFENIERLW